MTLKATASQHGSADDHSQPRPLAPHPDSGQDRAMAVSDYLGTKNAAQTLALGGFGALGVAMMSSSGSLVYGGLFVVLITCALLAFLHERELRAREWRHLLIPALVIAALIFPAGVLFYRKETSHPVTLAKFASEFTSTISAGVAKVLTNPESWFVVFSLWAFWIATHRVSRGAPETPPYGPDV